MICHWATDRTDPQNLLSTTLDVPLQQVDGPTWLSISKGPSQRCDNFGDRHVVLMSDASKYTQSPGLYTGAGVLL